MGVQFSDCLNDSVELIKLKSKCKSAGCTKYCFIRTNVTRKSRVINIANTTFLTGSHALVITVDNEFLFAWGMGRTRTADSK